MQLQWPLQKANNLKNMSVYVYCHIKVTAPSLEGKSITYVRYIQRTSQQVGGPTCCEGGYVSDIGDTPPLEGWMGRFAFARKALAL